MTPRTNARIAGFTFLFYIAVAFPSMVLFNRARSGAGLAAQLAGIAQHEADLRLAARRRTAASAHRIPFGADDAAFMWLPVAVFELTLGPWLLVKGVR